MRKHRRLTDSLLRSKIKKQYAGRLPSPVMTDPFVGRMYYNRNGRAIVFRKGRWVAL